MPIFFWDPTVFTVAVLLLGMGVVAKQIVVGLGGAILVIMIHKRLSRGAKRGAGKHLMWSIGITFVDPLLSKRGPKATQVDFSE